MFPSKIEFQQLIDLCNVNRFINSEIDINDVDNCVINSFLVLMTSRQRAFKDDFSELPAYRWIDQKNGISYNRAMKIFFKNDFDEKVYTNEAISNYHTKLKHGVIPERALYRLQCELPSIAKKAQAKEKMLSHIANCFMNFLYPDKELTPAEFKADIKEAIEALETSKNCFQKLQKYNDIFYGYNISKQHNFIEYHLTALKGLEKEYIFPAKKTNQQYSARMFIVSFLRMLLTENQLTSDEETSTIEFKSVIAFIMELMNFDCFDNPITEVNVRLIIKDEIDRQSRGLNIDKRANIKKPNLKNSDKTLDRKKRGLNRGLDDLLDAFEFDNYE